MGPRRPERPAPVRAAIDAQHHEMLARFSDPTSGIVRDEDLAAAYTRLLQALAELPREQLLGLRILADPRQRGRRGSAAVREAVPAPPRPDELILLRRIADASGYGFAVAEVRGQLTYANGVLCRLFGIDDPAAAVGRPLTDFYPQALHRDLAGRILPAVRRKGQWSGELPVASLRGGTTPTIQNLFILPGEQAAGGYLCLLAIDITDRKRIEDALRASEERFRSIFEASTIGQYRTTPEGEILIANPALVQMLGYDSFAELAARDLEADGYEPDYDRAQFRDELERENVIIGHETSWRRRDGRSLYVRESAHVVRDEEGRVLYYEGTVEDVTEQRRAERALRESEARLRAAVESLPFDFFMLDRDGRYVMQNSVCRERWGDIVGRLIEDVAPDAATLALWRRNNERAFAGETVAGEILLPFQGQPRHFHNIIAPITSDGEVRGILGVNIDIEDRVAAESALRESEANFRALGENASDGILIGRDSGPHLFINRRWAEITGYPLDQLYDKELADLIHPDDLATVRQRYRDRLAGKPVPRRYEVRVRRRGGELVPVEVTAAATTWHGEPAGLVIARDISERRRAEAALRESKERYRELIDGVDAILYSFDAEGRLTYISRAIESILGYAREERIGSTIFDIIHPEDRELVASRMQNLAAGQEVSSAEYRVLTRDGNIRWLRTSSRTVREDGRITGWRGFMTDITTLRETENALRESQEMYATLVEQAHIGVAIAQDEQIQYANRYICRLVGYEPQELIGEPFQRVMAPDQRPKTQRYYAARLRGEPAPAVYPLRLQHRDGHTFEAENSVGVIPYKGRPAVMVIIRNPLEQSPPAEEDR